MFLNHFLHYFCERCLLFLISMRLKNITLYIFLLPFMVSLLLSSCSSSKSVSENEYKPVQKEQKLSKSDKALIKEAKSWIGTKYKYGGHSRSGTDCSGFVMQVYKAVYDFKLPRTSRDQHDFCKKINKKDLKVGDLVFFATGKSSSKVSHVGLYIGNGEFIHASSSKGVIITDLNKNYYVRTFVSAGRVEGIKDNK